MRAHVLSVKKIIMVVLCVLVLCFALILIAGLIESNREQVYYETTRIDQPINIPNLSFAELDRVIQTEYPPYCEGMQLVQATAEMQIRNNVILKGEACLIYYRYIDESMEGGNVETNECRFDLVTNTFVSVEHCYGSGKSFAVNGQSIEESILKTPLNQYVNHAAELAGLQKDRIYVLNADCANSQMDLTLLTDQIVSPLYEEFLLQWPENDRFDERIFTTDS